MKTPRFWKSKNFFSTLLVPLGVFYDMAGTLRRVFTKPITLPIPVICVGNVTAGGAGKTPVALYIGERLKAKGIEAFFLSRGYGGKEHGPLRVDRDKHSARDVGDEPLLLSRVLPTIVARNRANGARMAAAQGAKVIVMDDGLQNPALVKDLSLIVIDGTQGFGNGRIFPAGPLREPFDVALYRAHAVIIINSGNRAPALPPGKPVLFAKTQVNDMGHALKGKRVLAFCGLAYPQKFFDTLRSCGATLVSERSFPDHYVYRNSEIRRLKVKADNEGAQLVTTAKDAVRLSVEARSLVTVVEIALAFDEPAALDAMLDYVMSPK